jgi:hypothetical protein
MSPGDRVAQLYSQALSFPLSRLLRHAGVRWGYSSLPHAEICRYAKAFTWTPTEEQIKSGDGRNALPQSGRRIHNRGS